MEELPHIAPSTVGSISNSAKIYQAGFVLWPWVIWATSRCGLVWGKENHIMGHQICHLGSTLQDKDIWIQTVKHIDFKNGAILKFLTVGLFTEEKKKKVENVQWRKYY